jgi:hypothetical protein
MANTDARMGLIPVKHLNGSPWNGATWRCYLNTSEGNALYVGDAVDLVGTADADGTCMAVTKATAGAGYPILGVITSFDVDPTQPELLYRTASTARYCQVCIDPTVIYEIQGDTAGVIAATDVGNNGAIVMTHTGNTTTGLSGMELNSSGLAVTSNLQLKIMGAVPRSDNDISSVNAKWLVLINLHRLFTGASNASAGTTILGATGV